MILLLGPLSCVRSVFCDVHAAGRLVRVPVRTRRCAPPSRRRRRTFPPSSITAAAEETLDRCAGQPFEGGPSPTLGPPGLQPPGGPAGKLLIFSNSAGGRRLRPLSANTRERPGIIPRGPSQAHSNQPDIPGCIVLHTPGTCPGNHVGSVHGPGHDSPSIRLSGYAGYCCRPGPGVCSGVSVDTSHSRTGHT